MVKAGLDVNEQGDMGYTPLHYAEDPEIIAFLLSHGASQDILSEFGTLPDGSRKGYRMSLAIGQAIPAKLTFRAYTLSFG